MSAFPWVGPSRRKNARKTMMAGQPILHPLQILFQEHVKYMVAIKELQSQVQKLHEFKSRVIQVFPQLASVGSYEMPVKIGPLNNRNETLSRKSATTGKAGRVLQTVSQPSVGHHQISKTQTLSRERNSQSAQCTATSQRRQLSDRPQWQSNKFVVIAKGKNWLRIRPCAEKSDSEMEDSDEEHNSTSDSLHSMMDQPIKRKAKAGSVGRKGEGTTVPRQDSGFSTDGKERLNQDRSSDVNWVKIGNTTDDELMNVLELIGEKSEVLRVQADKATSQGVTLSDIGLRSDDILNEMELLRSEKEHLLDRLVLAEAERDLYKTEMIRLRDSLIEMEATRRNLEDRLEMVSIERERLGSKIHRLHSQFARNTNLSSSPKADSTGTKNDSATQSTQEVNIRSSGSSSSELLQPVLGNGSRSLPDRLSQAKLKVRMDKSKISAILQESRALELQRQLLVAVLRNEVLKAQLEQSLGELHQKTATWEQIEFGLRSGIDVVQQKNNDLSSKLQQIETELRVERSKRQVLERALQAAYKDLTSSSGRGESVSSTENVRQLSVEVFPVHQIPMNHPSEKLAESSPAWKPMTSANSNGAPVVATTYTPSMATSHALGDYSNYHFSKVRINGKPQGAAALYNDQTEQRERSSQLAEPRLCATEDDVEHNDTLANLCLRLREAGQGTLSASEINSSAFTRASVASQVMRRLSLNEVNACRRDRNDTKLLVNSYVHRSSPKTQSDAFIPKYSQSAEDLRHSEWEWTYDLRDSPQHQHFSNVPQKTAMSQATSCI